MVFTTFRKLQDKHILILGGTSGVEFAAAQGAIAAVQTLKEQYGSKAVIQGFVCDVSTCDIEATLETLIKSSTSGAAGELSHTVYTAANSASLSLGSAAEADPATILAGARMRMFVHIMLPNVLTRYLPKSTESSLTFTSGQASDKSPPGWSLLLFFTGGVQTFAKGLPLTWRPFM